jgi:hypothetical protein
MKQVSVAGTVYSSQVVKCGNESPKVESGAKGEGREAQERFGRRSAADLNSHSQIPDVVIPFNCQEWNRMGCMVAAFCPMAQMSMVMLTAERVITSGAPRLLTGLQVRIR